MNNLILIYIVLLATFIYANNWHKHLYNRLNHNNSMKNILKAFKYWLKSDYNRNGINDFHEPDSLTEEITKSKIKNYKDLAGYDLSGIDWNKVFMDSR